MSKAVLTRSAATLAAAGAKLHTKEEAGLEPLVRAIETNNRAVDARLKSIEEKADQTASNAGGIAARLKDIEQSLAGRGGDGGPYERSIGQTVAESPQYNALKDAQGGRARINVKATLTTGPTSGGALAPSDRLINPIMLPQRRVRVRDLLSPGSTSSTSVEYPRQTTRTNAAATVAETAQKPESALGFEIVNTPVRTIAHLLPASKQILDDAPMLRSIIDNELIYMLGDVEELQLLMGDGIGTNLHGVYTLATPFSPVFTIASPTMLDVLLLAVAQTQAAGYDPDGMVLNPLDWARILTMKDGQGRYLANGPFGPEQIARLWTLPVAPTTAMTPGKFLITTRIGAQIFDREEAMVEISTEHADFFGKNLVMMRAEERLALAVYRPLAFTKGDFSEAITAATQA